MAENAESPQTKMKKSKSAPKLKVSKGKTSESSTTRSPSSQTLDSLLSSKPSAAASEYLLSQQSQRKSRSSEAINTPALRQSEQKSPRDKVKKEKTSSKTHLTAPTSGIKIVRAQSSSLSKRRRSSSAEESDSVGEAAMDISSSPEREPQPHRRPKLQKKPVNPTQMTYHDVAKEWSRMPASEVPKKREKMSAKDVAAGILWDRKHGL